MLISRKIAQKIINKWDIRDLLSLIMSVSIVSCTEIKHVLLDLNGNALELPLLIKN